MEKRLKLASTIKWTRSFHYIMPLSMSRLGVKWISLDDKFSLEVDLQQPKHNCLSLQHTTASQFLSAAYDGKWYIGMIRKSDFSNGGFFGISCITMFLQVFFRWPEKCDICWVPFQHVLFVIKAPHLVSFWL